MFAVHDDIQANWRSIKEILNNASFIGDYSNFYGHNDLGTHKLIPRHPVTGGHGIDI